MHTYIRRGEDWHFTRQEGRRTAKSIKSGGEQDQAVRYKSRALTLVLLESHRQALTVTAALRLLNIIIQAMDPVFDQDG